MSDKVILAGGEGEITEKKSRFIATIRPVHSEEEAQAFITEMKKKYYDARHNCSAYIIGNDASLIRSSDDGEPGGTAGRPMLEVLSGEGLYDVACVVTRYFGGVLLGTGGLVRAYQAAVKEGLLSCDIADVSHGYPLTLKVDYNLYGSIEYILREDNIPVVDTIYEDAIILKLMIPEELRQTFTVKVTELSSGSAIFEWSDLTSYIFGEKSKKVLAIP